VSSTDFDALRDRLTSLSRTSVLLVACDYDGTLSPIVSDPTQAFPHRETLVALRNLAALDRTHVAVISGRSLRDLAQLSGLPDTIRLVGSHGSEFDPDFAAKLSDEQIALRAQILAELQELAAEGDGLHIEEKPASIALHYRNASEAAAQRALERVATGPAAVADVYTKHGKKVVELLVLPTDKGHALDSVRHRTGATAVAFLGDDRTDEDAFATLTGPDVGIKVGAGDTLAKYRVDDTQAVARVLAMLLELREEWLSGGAAVPIERLSLLSDQRTAARVTPDARVSWLCVPRLDSPAIFAELLDGPAAGHFSVRAVDGSRPVSQAYRHQSMVLETRWPSFSVTDYLDISLGRSRQRAGRSDLIRMLRGRGRARIEFAPRLDFGRVPTRLARRPNGLKVEGWVEPIVLHSPGVNWEIREEGPHHTAHAEVDLGERGGTSYVALDLRYGTGSLENTLRSATERRDLTDAAWASWAERLVLPRIEPQRVLRSALLLKALCHTPTGAIAAAATTSLPEHIGGVRNWDYRFCWLRDAALTAKALARLDSYGEALAFLDWMLSVVDVAPSPGMLQPLYTFSGGQVPSEADISELGGYAASRPVRVANSASHQIQLDVYGPIVGLVHELMLREAPISPDHWRLVEAMVQAVSDRWREPDHGIWELRLHPRNHVYSKTMCWLTLDRALALSRTLRDEQRPEWKALRDTIAADIFDKGYRKSIGAFTASYEDDSIDAASLHVGLSGLVEPDDPRFASTVAAVERTLRDGPTVYRYRIDDGLPGHEGGFHLCTSWLIDAYHMIGRRQDARALFDELLTLIGPTGLLSEEYDVETGLALGNVPQAYSHLGLIENALRLSSDS
jgi:trehalose 6-phosphate phosphatase